jgi:hypothetical protein
MYEVTIQNKTNRTTAISDDILMLSVSLPPGTTQSFELPTEEDKDRMTPQLVQLDAIDGVDVEVKELK